MFTCSIVNGSISSARGCGSGPMSTAGLWPMKRHLIAALPMLAEFPEACERLAQRVDQSVATARWHRRPPRGNVGRGALQLRQRPVADHGACRLEPIAERCHGARCAREPRQAQLGEVIEGDLGARDATVQTRRYLLAELHPRLSLGSETRSDCGAGYPPASGCQTRPGSFRRRLVGRTNQLSAAAIAARSVVPYTTLLRWSMACSLPLTSITQPRQQMS